MVRGCAQWETTFNPDFTKNTTKTTNDILNVNMQKEQRNTLHASNAEITTGKQQPKNLKESVQLTDTLLDIITHPQLWKSYWINYKNMKTSNAAGPDEIIIELLKALSAENLEPFLGVLQHWWTSGRKYPQRDVTSHSCFRIQKRNPKKWKTIDPYPF